MDSQSVSLKEFLLEKLNTYTYTHKQVHEVEQKAREEAVKQLNGRLELMNEFRTQLNQQAALFVTRDMQDSKVKTLEVEIRRVESNISIRVQPLEDFQKSFYVKAVSVGTAFTLLNIIIAAVAYLGLGK